WLCGGWTFFSGCSDGVMPLICLVRCRATGRHIYWGNSMEVVAKLPTQEQRDSELKQVLKALGSFRRGETGVTLPTEWDGIYGKIATEFNELTSQTARTSNRLHSLDPASRSAAKPNRRMADDKLPGFWQPGVASVNRVP